VAAHGEIWRAMSDEPIPKGAPVRVIAIHGLTLTVRKE
jgi:membrane-bound ClpP family serine protease